MTALLKVEVDGLVALVTLDRPERRNALNGALLETLRSTMAELDADDTVAAVVLTGADPAFCAGLDLREIAEGHLDVAAAVSPVDPRPGEGSGAVAPSPFRPLGIPVIGAVNGPAVTGGLELALCCDFLVASEHAAFADTHARVGVQPGWGLTVNLAAAVGLRRAREMSATGNYVDAATALAWGLVNHVVPHHQLLPRALALARDVASNDGPAVARVLRTYAEGQELGRSAALLHESQVAAAWVAARPPVAADVGRRRPEVIDRGRRQSS